MEAAQEETGPRGRAWAPWALGGLIPGPKWPPEMWWPFLCGHSGAPAHLPASPSCLARRDSSTWAGPGLGMRGGCTLKMQIFPQRYPNFRVFQPSQATPGPIWVLLRNRLCRLSPSRRRQVPRQRPRGGGACAHVCVCLCGCSSGFHPRVGTGPEPLALRTCQHLSSVGNQGPKVGTWS